MVASLPAPLSSPRHRVPRPDAATRGSRTAIAGAVASVPQRRRLPPRVRADSRERQI